MFSKDTSKFRILSHTADAKFIASGDNLNAAFANAAYAMYDVLLKGDEIKSVVKMEFSKNGKTKEALLYDFLDELLFIMDTESLVLSAIENVRVDGDDGEFSVKCVAWFDKAMNYDIGGNIKAVTYSEIYIKEEKGNVELQVVVDI